MPMIRECIVTTLDEEGRAHIAPLGLIEDGDGWVIGPFRPSATLDNLRTTPFAVANFTDDVLVFAGCILGNKDWPTKSATHAPGAVLEAALAHVELESMPADSVIGVSRDRSIFSSGTCMSIRPPISHGWLWSWSSP